MKLYVKSQGVMIVGKGSEVRMVLKQVMTEYTSLRDWTTDYSKRQQKS